MADWASVMVGVVLFVLLSLGLVMELLGTQRRVEFGSLRTNGKATTIHSLVFFTLFTTT
ncbi:hypothetical protein QJS10_CPB19g00576 [Acorus calamus]|uniref:Uncharacterized protein n=1 Tax=Acorus calamus TaxID=4465 RepID=A0AAV9CFR7_ACOCL|nr:hypothetical protein QJS10_CPB19g00576 [Acorus calamus]